MRRFPWLLLCEGGAGKGVSRHAPETHPGPQRRGARSQAEAEQQKGGEREGGTPRRGRRGTCSLPPAALDTIARPLPATLPAAPATGVKPPLLLWSLLSWSPLPRTPGLVLVLVLVLARPLVGAHGPDRQARWQARPSPHPCEAEQQR